MITRELISPKSIVVVGGSDDTTKPGGNAVKNLLDTKYNGQLYVVNPKSSVVQGLKSYNNVSDIPQTECAILAIAARYCPETVRILCRDKGCRAIIIFSAGFGEDSPQGAKLEREIVEIVNEYGASLIGPNCIGVITNQYAGVFTHPIENVSPNGVDLISGSGATIVFIMEAAHKLGISFSNVFSVGNCAQIGIEEVLEYLDNTYEEGVSSPVKLLYIESIHNPNKLQKHASSLIAKGARIAAIKSGYSQAGSQAASSHTGAIATPDNAVDALFNKCGIIRAYSRSELTNLAAVLSFPKPKGNRMAIITHAGGPAVMLTDILNSNGIEIPRLSGKRTEELLEKLYAGSQVNNPIDFLSTGTAEQLGHIIDACNNHFDVDSMAVIFGSPGLTDVSDVYSLLLNKMKETKKPIYPILPSVVNAKDAIEKYQKHGGISFSEEVDFGKAFIKMMNAPMQFEQDKETLVDKDKIEEVLQECKDGYLMPEQVNKLLDAAGIARAEEVVTDNINTVVQAAERIGYPIVMKVVGPVHKTDVGGVSLNITDIKTLKDEFNRMMGIENAVGVLLQPMLSGTEMFIGAKQEGNFGTLIMCGLGGIFIEVLKDVQSALSPVTKEEALKMIKQLKGYKILEGTRGKEGIDIEMFANTIVRVSALCDAAGCISEMDINPLLCNARQVTAVDARIKIKK